MVEVDHEATRAFQLRDIRAKAANGQRLTSDERREVWIDVIDKVAPEISDLFKAGRAKNAAGKMLVEMAAGFIGAAERSDKLEDRIAALESAPQRERTAPEEPAPPINKPRVILKASAKPRVILPAGSAAP